MFENILKYDTRAVQTALLNSYRVCFFFLVFCSSCTAQHQHLTNMWRRVFYGIWNYPVGMGIFMQYCYNITGQHCPNITFWLQIRTENDVTMFKSVRIWNQKVTSRQRCTATLQQCCLNVVCPLGIHCIEKECVLPVYQESMAWILVSIHYPEPDNCRSISLLIKYKSRPLKVVGALDSYSILLCAVLGPSFTIIWSPQHNLTSQPSFYMEAVREELLTSGCIWGDNDVICNKPIIPH